MIVRKLAVEAAKKAAKVDASDVMTQMNTQDIITLLKGLL